MPARDHIEVIAARYRAGETLEQIGQTFGVTRERIRQLLRDAGVDSANGGAKIRTARKAAAFAEGKARRFFMRYGMTRAMYRAINSGVARPDMPITAYTQQVGNARMRGIEWRFTFGTWWAVWLASGQWDKRGRTTGNYVMSRFGDVGPYSPDNVKIVTNTENICEHYGISSDRVPVGDLLEIRNRCGRVIRPALDAAGLSKSTWSLVVKGKIRTIDACKAEILRRELLRMSAAFDQPQPAKAA